MSGASAFNIRGDQMGGTSVTPEVFRTNAPTTANTYWRMFQGGTTAGFERGQLFADPANAHFNINAPNGHMRLYTNSLERMRMNRTGTSTINGFTGVPTSGFVGISARPGFFTGTVGPFSRLHLVDSIGPNSAITYAQQYGFRPWQRNGITFTGNADQAYIGQKYRADDQTDFVIQWSDNPAAGQWAPDYMRFVFTSNYTGTRNTGARSLEGLEAMRIFPVDSFHCNVGIGDWWSATVDSAGIDVNPRERLDILDRTVRIRQLIPDFNNDTLSRVVVVDSSGRLNWRRVSSLPTGGGGSNCTWEVNNGHAVTAWRPNGSNGTCPEVDNFVGIGTANPTAKLHVMRTESTAGDWSGMACSLTAAGTTNGTSGSLNTAISGNVVGGGFRVRGVYGTAVSNGTASTYLMGAEGSADASGGTVAETIGLYGNANSAGVAYGVKGATTGNNPLSRAGYFLGNLEYTGNFIQPSDQNLKENISALTGALATLSQLQPKRFNFRCSDPQLAQMNLPQGPQMGLIAQEVQQVLPALVHDSHLGASFNANGQCTGTAIDYKSMDYGSLIPLLIGAINELKGQVDACCAAGQQHAPIQAPEQNEDVRTERLNISPNPFTTSTTLRYFIAQEGRARLEVSDQSGRLLDVLREERTMEGEHSYEWNTSNLASGTYFVALVVDGNMVVKRAVKVGER